MFDFEFETTCAPPPPLSLSSPELGTVVPTQQPIRSAVSSTELLYERAMDKFYQAVAKEEAVQKDKLSRDSKILPSIGIENLERCRSFSEGDNNQLEVHRNQTDKLIETSFGKHELNFQDPFKPKESMSVSVTASPQDKQVKILENVQINVNEEEVYNSDYTDSTISSADSIVAKMASLKERLSHIESDDEDEVKTYHPRTMDLQSLTSPYKLPDHGQAVNILNKPHKLPDPNFVPKPILKRPISPTSTSSNKPVLNNSRAFSPPPTYHLRTGSPLIKSPSPRQKEMNENRSIKENASSVKEEKNGLKKFIKQITTSTNLSDKNRQTCLEEVNKNVFQDEKQPTKFSDVLKPNSMVTINSTRPKISSSNERGRKLLQQRQNSEEENKTVIDHYTTILRDHDTTRLTKDKVPIYLNPDAIKMIQEKAKEDGEDIDLEEEQNKHKTSHGKRELDISSLTFMRRQRNSSSSLNRGSQSRDQSLSRNQVKDQFSATIVLKSNSLPKNKKDGSRDSVLSKHRDMSLPTKYLPLFTTFQPDQLQDNEVDDTLKRNNNNGGQVQYPRSESGSQISTRSKTPQELNVEERMKSNLSYVMDLCLLGFSFYLYVFKDAIFCIPILILLIYRQLGDVIKDNHWQKKK